MAFLANSLRRFSIDRGREIPKELQVPETAAAAAAAEVVQVDAVQFDRWMNDSLTPTALAACNDSYFSFHIAAVSHRYQVPSIFASRTTRRDETSWITQ